MIITRGTQGTLQVYRGTQSASCGAACDIQGWGLGLTCRMGDAGSKYVYCQTLGSLFCKRVSEYQHQLLGCRLGLLIPRPKLIFLT